MNTHPYIVTCAVCQMPGSATPQTASQQWLEDAFVAHEDTSICVANINALADYEASPSAYLARYTERQKMRAQEFLADHVARTRAKMGLAA